MSLLSSVLAFFRQSGVFVLFTSFFAVFCFLPFFAGAAASDIAINEIAWMGTEVLSEKSSNWWRYEWLELYNKGANDILLDGWSLEFYGKAGLDWVLDLEGKIPAKGYFLIVSSEKIFNSFDLNYKNLAGKMNNDGEKLVLKNSLSETIEELDCQKGWFFGDNEGKQTMERTDPAILANIRENWKTSEFAGGTPGKENSKAPLASPSIKENSQVQQESAENNPLTDPKYSADIKDFTPDRSGFPFLALALLLAVPSGFIALLLKKRLKG